MGILDPILTLIQQNLLSIITVLWIIWFAGMALGIVISTVSSCRNRLILARQGRYASAGRRRGQDAVHLELDPERIKNILIHREVELREDTERMGSDFGLQRVLENFRGRIQQRLADIPATLYELENRLRNIYAGLDDFKDICGSDQISLAQMALRHGATGKAAALLKRAQSLGSQQAAGPSGSEAAVVRNQRLAANATFLLGQLAETDFNYFTATQYYQLAADLQPSNLTYLKAAAEFSYAFEEFHETGHLLEQVLTIQGKLLGPEHMDLAQTLNNLGVLRHTQGRHAEAESFYLWALEICEAQPHPQDQDTVNLMRNYATFLQERGRHQEADAVKTRAALA